MIKPRAPFKKSEAMIDLGKIKEASLISSAITTSVPYYLDEGAHGGELHM